MVKPRFVRTVSDSSGTPILEIIKEEDTITVFEADDLTIR